jgi:hypothetical protein
MATRRLLLQSLLVTTVGAAWPQWAAAHAHTAGEALSGQRAIGQSLFRWFGLEVYRATLYAAPGFEPQGFEGQRFGLELEYRRAFDGPAIAKRSLDEMQGIAPLDPGRAREWLDRMARTFPDVAPGDRLLGLHDPARGARFYLNGRLHGVVDDPEFSARFFGIWLSPRTSQPKLRDALIAGATR